MSASASVGAGAADLLRAISDRRDEIAALTAELIAACSENPPGDERAAVATLRRALVGLPGVKLDVVEAAPHRQSLLASAGPQAARTLLLGAHLDTVPAGDGWSRDPFGRTIVDDRVYGRGASDIKGGAAAMTIAFAALVRAGVTSAGRLLLVANADEEMGGRLGMDRVRDELTGSIDGALIAEPSGVAEPFERLYVAARGAMRFTVATRGSGGHSSLTRETSVGSAAEKLLALLGGLRGELPVLARAHPRYGEMADLILVRLAAGTGWGVVPSSATADLELRVPPGTDRDTLEAELRAAVDAAGAELRLAPGSMAWVAPSEVDARDPLVDAASSAWRTVLGRPPQLACYPAGTDARSLTERGIPTLPALGPGTLLRAHRPDEFVGVGELEAAAQLYAVCAQRFLHEYASDSGGRDGHDRE